MINQNQQYPGPKHLKAWARFYKEADRAKTLSILELFTREPKRLERFCLTAAGLYLDLSKQGLTTRALASGLYLARQSGVSAARDAMFRGEIMNLSENRPVLHTALRAFSDQAPDKSDPGRPRPSPEIEADIRKQRRRLYDFARKIRAQTLSGNQDHKPSHCGFRTIVHLGIGGSDLGPKLVFDALKPLRSRSKANPGGPDLRFVANVDAAALALATCDLDPKETLVVIVSKTFTTEETLANARTIRLWLQQGLGEGADLSSHLVAVTANKAKALEFGIQEDHIFGFWDWVGGRFSVWSSVGLSLVLSLGEEVFEALLRGAAAMDQHFLTARLKANAPVLLALAHIYNRNGLGRFCRAVVPYAERLKQFPAFLQQLEMESNGKQTTALGKLLEHHSAGVIFGDVGTNGQHAFFQLLHQGTDIIPVDLIGVIKAGDESSPDHQDILLANLIAQAEALMIGRDQSEVREELLQKSQIATDRCEDNIAKDEGEIDKLAPQKTFFGNRPSSLILLPRLDPESLGALIALYEHKTFVEGVLLQINSFDQWGVELGKNLAKRILPELQNSEELQNSDKRQRSGLLEKTPPPSHDPSTLALIKHIKTHR